MSIYDIKGVLLLNGQTVAYSGSSCAAIKGDPVQVMAVLEEIRTPPPVTALFTRDFSQPKGAWYEDKLIGSAAPTITDGKLIITNTRSTFGDIAGYFFEHTDAVAYSFPTFTMEIHVVSRNESTAQYTSIRAWAGNDTYSFSASDVQAAVENGTPLIVDDGIVDGGYLSFSCFGRVNANTPLGEAYRISKIVLIPR